MKQLLGMAILGFCLSVSLLASERQTRTFRIAEGNPGKIGSSPYILTMTSSDLTKYPRAVVTFEVQTDPARAPGSIAPPDSIPERVRVRRHYIQLEPDQFGRDGEARVVFDREAHTVFLGFLGKAGKTFYYREETQQPRPLVSSSQDR